MATKAIARSDLMAASAVGGLRSGTVQLALREGINAKSVHAALDRIFRLHGCITCGLAGLDLRLRVQEKLLAEQFADIDGVQDVNILR